MIYVDRNGNRTEGTTGQDRLLEFIYAHTATRLLIRPFLSPWVSKLGGTFLSTRLSAVAIRPFVEKNQIDLSQSMKSRSLLLIMNFSQERSKQKNVRWKWMKKC